MGQGLVPKSEEIAPLRSVILGLRHESPVFQPPYGNNGLSSAGVMI